MRQPALDLAGRTDLGSLAALVARLDLLITNDTGASHVAAATGTPSVILFGPNRPEVWAPLDRHRHRVVAASALASDGIDPAHALQHLPVEPVFALCQEQLDPHLSPIAR
jgi:ADP-heptose:LPS heptosyltransferase